MRRLAFVGFIVAIALSSCQAGLKNQVLGKWENRSGDKGVCIDEYLEKYLTTTCYLGEEKLFTVSSAYEIDGSDRIITTSSRGVKDVFTVKINGEKMEIQKAGEDRWSKYSRVK